MNSNDFIACIQQAQETPEVQQALAKVGFTQKLQMPRDDIDARVETHGLGLSLIFKPESAQSSRLILTAVKFHSDKDVGFNTFPGPLPSGLLFSDTRTEALAKLGEPCDAMPELRRDIWRWNGLQLATRYAKQAPHQLTVITVEVPFEDEQ